MSAHAADNFENFDQSRVIILPADVKKAITRINFVVEDKKKCAIYAYLNADAVRPLNFSIGYLYRADGRNHYMGPHNIQDAFSRRDLRKIQLWDRRKKSPYSVINYNYSVNGGKYVTADQYEKSSVDDKWAINIKMLPPVYPTVEGG